MYLLVGLWCGQFIRFKSKCLHAMVVFEVRNEEVYLGSVIKPYLHQ